MNIAKRVVHVGYGTTAYQTSSFEYEAAAYVFSRIVLYGLKNRLLNQFPKSSVSERAGRGIRQKLKIIVRRQASEPPGRKAAFERSRCGGRRLRVLPSDSVEVI